MAWLAVFSSGFAWVGKHWMPVERFFFFREHRVRVQEAETRKVEADARIKEQQANQELCSTLRVALEAHREAKEAGADALAEDILTAARLTLSSVVRPASVSNESEIMARPLLSSSAHAGEDLPRLVHRPVRHSSHRKGQR